MFSTAAETATSAATAIARPRTSDDNSALVTLLSLISTSIMTALDYDHYPEAWDLCAFTYCYRAIFWVGGTQPKLYYCSFLYTALLCFVFVIFCSLNSKIFFTNI